MNLKNIGFNENRISEFRDYQAEYIPGRVISESRNLYRVVTDAGERPAILNDKFWFETQDKSLLPVVGDWVVLSEHEGLNNLKIHNILPRKSKFARKAVDSFGRNYSKSGTSEEQVISANVDYVILVISLDREFNLRKIERYMTLMWDSGANPVIILNKADDCPDYESYVEQVEAICYGIPVHAISAKTGFGMETFDSYLKTGETISFIGSSGVGKSSIINYLSGSKQMWVYDVRDADHRGRHTTTHREMIILENGASIIDNPGMRDIKVQGDPGNLELTFRDIIELQRHCKFRNCQHDTEPGCAIKEAIDNGELEQARFNNYKKLQRELIFLAKRKKERVHKTYNQASLQAAIDREIRKKK